MLLDALNREMAASTELNTFHTRVLVRTDEKLLSGYEFVDGDKTFMVINSYNYQIEYQPRNDQPRYIGKPYLFSFPTEVKLRKRYADWADFCSECEHEPQLRWLKKWSYIDEKFFELVKNNKGLKFSIPFNLVGYDAYLREQFREQFGEDAGERALLCAPYEGEASAAAKDEYKKQIYAGSIERKISKNKKGDK